MSRLDDGNVTLSCYHGENGWNNGIGYHSFGKSAFGNRVLVIEALTEQKLHKDQKLFRGMCKGKIAVNNSE